MKSFKIILIAGLLAGVFSQTVLAEGGSDPNLQQTDLGAGVNSEGAVNCAKCTGATDPSTLGSKKAPNTAYDSLLSESGTGAAGSKTEGTH